jgi:translocation protein SEC62
MGRHHFWLLPNLTEDCGFFESFKPLYSHSVAGDGKKDKDGGRHKKNDDDNVPKDSADEDDNVDGK